MSLGLRDNCRRRVNPFAVTGFYSLGKSFSDLANTRIVFSVISRPETLHPLHPRQKKTRTSAGLGHD